MTETKEIIEKNKSSLTLTFRKKKEGLDITGFDVKVYGDNPNEMSQLALDLENVALKRMFQYNQINAGNMIKEAIND
tara:strand:+ start:53 stop:283 length:231 start_codon:yes stop_codon:yes gene_type:complete